MLALAKLSPTTVLPLVVETVSELSALAYTGTDPPIQLPFIEKHPALKLKPLAEVEVAPVPVRLRDAAASPPEKVEVEFTPSTVRNPCKVDVPLVALWMVVVDDPPMSRLVKLVKPDAMTEPTSVRFPDDVSLLNELKNRMSPNAPLAP